MQLIILGSYILVPAVFNIVVQEIKKNRTIRKIKEKLEEKGFDVDERFVKQIPKVILDTKIDFPIEDYKSDIRRSFIILYRWIIFDNNIKYLNGDYQDTNEIYALLEDAVDDKEIIEKLKKNKFIQINKEKKKWISDRNRALRELDRSSKSTLEQLKKKYDRMEALREKNKLLKECNENNTQINEQDSKETNENKTQVNEQDSVVTTDNSVAVYKMVPENFQIKK